MFHEINHPAMTSYGSTMIFIGETTPRIFSDPGPQEILYPIHLAAKLGDALALQAIIDAGADLTKKRLGDAPGDFSCQGMMAMMDDGDLSPCGQWI